MGIQRKSSHKTLIDKLTAEIEGNLNNDQFGVDSLAQTVGMSRSNLHRKLQKAVGVSTSQFIREYRLKRALEILKQEDITASEAAYRVGFSSATYFNTCFHKFYGYTPGEVKSRNHDEVETLIKSETTAIGKDSTKKRALWLVLAAIVFLATGLYYYNANNDEKNVVKTDKNEINEKSIAVLPFKNLTGKPDLEYVSDGMTDAVISRLTKISAIDQVIPFTSTLSYKETDKTIEEIATELGVQNLLQGNLQISGNQIKINLQLIDANSNEHLWSEEFVRDWKSDEIFEIQNEVVEGIATNMNAEIAKDELADIQEIPTKSKEAYSYYLQAEFQKIKANALAHSSALELYGRAIAIDSNFVEPYLGMATTWMIGGLNWGFYDEQEAWDNAKGLIRKALELDPTSIEISDELYGGYFYFDWDFERVDPYYKERLRNPFYDNTPGINADYAIKTGRYENAIRSMDEHILVDPSVGIFFFFKAEALMFLGRNNEAIEIINKADPLHSDNYWYLRESTKLRFYFGEYEKSKIQLNKILTQFPDYPPILMWFNAVYSQMDGNSRATAKYLNELRDKYNDRSSGSPAWFMALYYAHIEDYEKAFDWLQKSYDRHEVEMTWLREEPLLAPIRRDPRYKELYDKVGFSSIGIPIKSSAEY